ncbi:MAG TPA: tetratricopeptide repeat protein [Pirellulales bacterium]|nr:tetratricopeptide repeat protein [Pirellulales bacterium]
MVGLLHRGDTFAVQEIRDGWYWVSEIGRRGWVRQRDAMPIDRAIRFFTEAIRQNPTAADYAIRGRLRNMKGGQIAGAIADFSEAIRLDPSQAELYKERGINYYIRREFDKAIADYAEAIRLAPDNPDYLALRANTFREKGDDEQAIADYSSAIRLSPSRWQSFEARARLWLNKDEYDRAIADFDEAIRLNPSPELASLDWVGRAGARLAKGDSEQAVKEFNEAVRLSADDPWIRDYVRGSRAIAWLGLERYDDAISDLEKGIESSPRQSGFYAVLAWTRAACPDARYRDGAKAVENATKAVELKRYPNADREAILAAAYAEAGDFDRAVESQKKAIELAPPNEKSHFREALELFEQGMPYREQHPDGWHPGFSFDTFIQ